jgi:hypothetical protein
MQAELQADHPEKEISILSLNLIGAEAGVELFTEIHGLPMVNDSEDDLLWAQWSEHCTIEDHDSLGKHWRDLYILNKSNQVVEVYNLTMHNLSDPVNYEELKQKFLTAASE